MSESEWVVYDDTVIFSTCQFIMCNQQALRRDAIRSMFVHRTVKTSRFVRFSVAATPAGRLPARERNTMTRKRRKIRLRTSHIPITVLYTPQRLLGRLRTRISLRGGSTGHRQPAQLVTIAISIWPPIYILLGQNRAESGLLYVPGAGLFLFRIQPTD